MEQIFTSLLTDLKIVHAHLLLRGTHQKLPIYRQEINDWILCNNINIKIVEQADASFNQNKIQFCSALQYNNSSKSVENLYCGTYANGVIPFALNMHHNKVQPYLQYIGIRPFKFKVRPYIKVEDSLLKIKRSRDRHRQRNEEQSKSPHEHESVHNRYQSTHICMKRKKGQQGSCSGEGKDEKHYSGRKCYCCSNRSNEEDESSNEEGFHRSPLKLQFEKTGGRGLKNWVQQNIEKDQDALQIKNKTYLPLRGKSSESLRNKSSPSLHFHTLIKRNNHTNTHTNSGGLANLIPSSNRYTNSVIESHKNSSITTLPNKWIKSQQIQQINVHNSPNEQKDNVKVKPIKREKHLLAGIRGVHGSSGKNSKVIDSEQIIKQQRQLKLSREKLVKNQVQVQKNQSKLGLKQALNQLMCPQRFSEMVEPIEESKFQFVGYSQDEKILLNNNLIEPSDAVKKPDNKLQNSILSKIRQLPLKMQNIKESNRKSPQLKINNLFTKNNLEQIKDGVKPANSQIGKVKTNRIKRIPLTQKKQIMKQQQQNKDLSVSKDKSTKNKIEQIGDNVDTKQVKRIRTQTNKQQKKEIEMKEQGKKQEAVVHQQPNFIDQESKQEIRDNSNLQLQLQELIILPNQNKEIEKLQAIAIKMHIQQMKQITETSEDFSMTQQRILSKDENITQNPCETHENSCIPNSQKISGNAASINDDASTIKEVDYQQEELSDIGNNQIQNSQRRCSTSRTIPYWLQPNQKSQKILQNKCIFDKQSMVKEKIQQRNLEKQLEQMRLSCQEGYVSSTKDIKLEFQQKQSAKPTEIRQQCQQLRLFVQKSQKCLQQKQFKPNQYEIINIINVENEQTKLRNIKQGQNDAITSFINLQTLEVSARVGSSHILLSDQQINEPNDHIIQNQAYQNSQQYYQNQVALEDVKDSNLHQNTLHNVPLERNQVLQNLALSQKSSGSVVEDRQLINLNNIPSCQIQSINQLSSNIQKQFITSKNGQIKTLNKLQQKQNTVLDIKNIHKNDKNDCKDLIQQNNHPQVIKQINQEREILNKITELPYVDDNIRSVPIQYQKMKHSNYVEKKEQIGKSDQGGSNKIISLQIQSKQQNAQKKCVFHTSSKDHIQQQIFNYHDPPTTIDHNENTTFMPNNNELCEYSAVQLISALEAQHPNQNYSQAKKQQQLNQEQIVQMGHQQAGEGIEYKYTNKDEKQLIKKEYDNCLFYSNQLLHQQNDLIVEKPKLQQLVVEEENKDNQKEGFQNNNISNQRQEYEQEYEEKSNMHINLETGNIQSNDGAIKEQECFKILDKDNNLPLLVSENQNVLQQAKGTVQQPIQQQIKKYQKEIIPLKMQEQKLQMTNEPIIDWKRNQKRAIIQKRQYQLKNEEIYQQMQIQKTLQSNVQQFDNYQQQNSNIIDSSPSKQLYPTQKMVDHPSQTQLQVILIPLHTTQHKIQESNIQDKSSIENSSSKSEIRSLKDESELKALQNKSLELEPQNIKPEYNFTATKSITTNQLFPIPPIHLQQKTNQFALNIETISFIQDPNNEQKIVKISSLTHNQQQIIIIPNKEDKNQQKTSDSQIQSLGITEIKDAKNNVIDHLTSNAQLTARHDSQIKRQSAEFINEVQNNPIQVIPQYQQLLLIKQQKIEQPNKGNTIKSSNKQSGKYQKNIINSQKTGNDKDHKQKQQEKNHPTYPKQIILTTFIKETQNIIVKEQVIPSQICSERQSQPQNIVTQNTVQNIPKHVTIQQTLSEDILQQRKCSQKQYSQTLVRQQRNQQLENKLPENIQINLKEIDDSAQKKEVDNQKWKRQYLLNTISVQTDELLKSFKQIQTQQLINNIIPISVKQSQIHNQHLPILSKQIKKQKLMICDPQFASLSDGNTSRRNIDTIINSNSGNIRLSQTAHQFQPLIGKFTQNNIQDNKSNKLKKQKLEENFFNNNNDYANMDVTKQIQQPQSPLKLGQNIQQNNQAYYEQSTKQLNKSSLLEKQFLQDQIEGNKNQQKTLLKDDEIKQAQYIEEQNQQMEIDLQNKQCKQTSHPLIIEKIVNNNISVVKFEQLFIHHDKDYKKQEIINNAIRFVECYLPEFISLLLNKENTQICLFIEGQWTIFKIEISSQTFTLQNLLFLNLKEQSIFRCIDMMTGMPMRILRDKQQGINNKRLLKSIKTLIQKNQNEEYEKILYSVHKSTHEIVCLHKIRNFLDNNNELKIILECKKINRQQQTCQQKEELYNLQGQSVQQFVQIHLLSSIRYLTFDINNETINTYELQLSNVVVYLNGTYKFILYQEFNRNQYKLAKESYKWMGYRCPEAVTKFLLIIEPIPNKEGQNRITLRLGINKNQEFPSIYRLISSEKGLKTRNCEGGYQNVSNVYLPVIKQIIKGRTIKKEKVTKQ